MISLRVKMRTGNIPSVFNSPRPPIYRPITNQLTVPSSIRCHSQISLQSTQTTLPIEVLKRIEKNYTPENVLKVLNDKSVLLSPGSVMLTVVTGFTNQQLRILKSELEKNVLQRDIQNIEQVLEYLKNLNLKFDKKKKFRDLIRNGLENDLVSIFNATLDPSHMNKLFQLDFSRITGTYSKGHEDELISQVITLMDLYWALSTQFNVYWSPRFDHRRFMTFSNIVTKSTKTHDIYKKLIEYSSPIVNHSMLSPARAKLRNGGQRDLHLYEFQEMFETKDQEVLDALKSRFVHLYSFKMIRGITTKYINKNNDKSKTYLDLLIAKASIDMNNASSKNIQDKIKTDLYEVVLYHSVRMGNYHSAIPILEQIQQNGLAITPKIFHSIFTSLRKKKFYDAALILLRSIPEEFIKEKDFKSFMVSEFLVLLREKFHDNPVMILSHYITIFNNSHILLNELGVLSLALPVKSIGKIHDLDVDNLVTADLPNSLIIGEDYPSIRNMTELYVFVLNYLSKQHSTKNINDYEKLFTLMTKHARLIQSNEAIQPMFKNHPFSSRNLDDAILNTFLHRVLKDFKKPSTALKMIEEFLTLKLKKFDPTFLTYIFSLHNDEAAYKRLIELMEEYQIQPDFAYVTGQIFKSYNNNDVETAKKWYDILCAWKFPIKSGRLIRFIDKIGWEFPEEFDKKLLDVVLGGEDLSLNGMELYEVEEEIHDDAFAERLKNMLESRTQQG